jgi:membrane protease YdiL (CAAX protease family)
MVPVFWGITFFMSTVYALMYLSTRSLRLPVLSHFLADLGNLSIFVF